METILIDTLNMEPSRIGLGAWAIGGTMRGGTDAMQAIQIIRRALDKGINIIDTAPAHGFGRSEEIVGRALKEHGRRQDVIISTKAGLEWNEAGAIVRNSTRQRILKEVDESLRRLQTNYIDIYFVHWPDKDVTCQETAEAMNELFRAHKIRSIGVSNFTPKEMDAFREAAPLAIAQFPFNLFERAEEDFALPYCRAHNIATMTYGTHCRGLLTGETTRTREFADDDLRRADPKFQEPNLSQYLEAARQLDDYVRRKYGRRILHLAARWVLDRAADIALWSPRRTEQLDAIDAVSGLILTEEDFARIDQILLSTITKPIKPDFMAPLTRTQYRSGKP